MPTVTVVLGPSRATKAGLFEANNIMAMGIGKL
jgi:hypothetical protein